MIFDNRYNSLDTMMSAFRGDQLTCHTQVKKMLSMLLIALLQ